MSGNFSDDIGLQCDTNSSDWKTLLVLPLPVGSLILNIFLFVAASKNRRKLQRQNYIFACVTSTLASNVLYLLFQVWILIDNFVSPVYEPRIGEVCILLLINLKYYISLFLRDGYELLGISSWLAKYSSSRSSRYINNSYVLLI